MEGVEAMNVAGRCLRRCTKLQITTPQSGRMFHDDRLPRRHESGKGRPVDGEASLAAESFREIVRFAAHNFGRSFARLHHALGRPGASPIASLCHLEPLPTASTAAASRELESAASQTQTSSSSIHHLQLGLQVNTRTAIIAAFG